MCFFNTRTRISPAGILVPMCRSSCAWLRVKLVSLHTASASPLLVPVRRVCNSTSSRQRAHTAPSPADSTPGERLTALLPPQELAAEANSQRGPSTAAGSRLNRRQWGASGEPHTCRSPADGQLDSRCGAALPVFRPHATRKCV